MTTINKASIAQCLSKKSLEALLHGIEYQSQELENNLRTNGVILDSLNKTKGKPIQRNKSSQH